MASSIEIVIRGKDEFSNVFGRLDEAFAGLDQSGGQLSDSIHGITDRLSGLAGAASGAAQSSLEFTQGMGENFAALLITQGETLSELGQQHVAAAMTLGEQLLEIDSGFQERLAAQQAEAHALQRLELDAHLSEVERKIQSSLNLIETYEQVSTAARLERFRYFFETLSELAASQGSSMAQFSKTLAIAEALIASYLAANRALAGMPYPFNLAAAALVLAQGLANVQRIREVNVAHGGLEHVPEEATFLLQRGERVLSPNQNRELTHFLNQENRKGGRGEVRIDSLTIHILENATAGEALLSMQPDELRQVMAEKLIPAMEELARLGIRPEFVENNT